MSNPNEYYYDDIKKWLMMKDKLPAEREQVQKFNIAVTEALVETEKLPNGELRLKAINDILFKKTHTYEGVAQNVYYERRTIQQWITSFVNLVGEKAGF